MPAGDCAKPAQSPAWSLRHAPAEPGDECLAKDGMMAHLCLINPSGIIEHPRSNDPEFVTRRYRLPPGGLCRMNPRQTAEIVKSIFSLGANS